MACLILASFYTEARGQVYSDGALFYIRSDKSLESEGTGIMICKFDGEKMYRLGGKKNDIGKQLVESINYYDDFDKCYSSYPGYLTSWGGGRNKPGHTTKKGVYKNFDLYEIDNSLPSSSRTVYSDEWFLIINILMQELFMQFQMINLL